MDTKTVATEQKPDPQAADFAAQKALFDAAVAKTKLAQGGPLPEKGGPAATTARTPPEKPAEEPEPKPQPKPKKPKQPKPEEPSALEKQIAALQAEVAELKAPKPEEPEDPYETLRAKMLSKGRDEEEVNDLIEMLETAHAPQAKRLAQLEKILEDATKAGRASISKSNQRRLSEAHAQLKNPDVWKVIDSAVMSGSLGRFTSVEDAYDAAVALIYGEEEGDDGDEVPEDVEREASRIAASSMTAPSKTPRKEARSYDERAKEHFEFIKSNPDDKAGALRLARELGLRP
jgi:hypothetical protein